MDDLCAHLRDLDATFGRLADELSTAQRQADAVYSRERAMAAHGRPWPEVADLTESTDRSLDRLRAELARLIRQWERVMAVAAKVSEECPA